jgi:signal transduction histidine kinase
MNGSEEFEKITVSDNGIGFRQSDAEKIFQTFSRLHPKDRYEGTGLGLALCKHIMERSGGFIYAEGKEGGGATITMLFPSGA